MLPEWLGAVMLVGSEILAAADPSLRITPARARVSPGATIQFRPQPATEAAVTWSVVGAGFIDRTGLYSAPYEVRVPASSARIVLAAGTKDDMRLSMAQVDLTPGVFRGANDCLGEGQAWSTTCRGLDYIHVDELPVATRSANPEYARSAQARGFKGMVVASALLCRSGEVIDAWVTWPEGTTPNAELERLAIDAAKQYRFRPAMYQGRPVAILVAIPLRFAPPE